MLYVIRMLNVTKLFSPIYTSLLVITCVWIVLFDKYLTFLNFSLSLNIRTSLNGIRILNPKHISKSTKRKRQNVKQLPSFTGSPRKNVPLEEGRTSAKGTFFLGHLVYGIFHNWFFFEPFPKSDNLSISKCLLTRPKVY